MLFRKTNLKAILPDMLETRQRMPPNKSAYTEGALSLDDERRIQKIRASGILVKYDEP